MILELLDYLRTPASSQAKKYGYLHEAIALKARAQRHQDAWAPHLRSCMALVDRSLNSPRGQKIESICVLGSGPLADLSPAIFAPGIRQIILIDIVHNLEVRKRAAQDPRIQLLEMDLSGSLHELSRERTKTFSFTQAAESLELPQADLYISANLMSQLPIPIIKSLKLITVQRQDTEARKNLESQLALGHWRLLEKLSRRGSQVVLWTDTRKQFLSSRGEILHQEESLGEFQFPVPVQASWDWLIAPQGEIAKDFALVMKVDGLVL